MINLTCYYRQVLLFESTLDYEENFKFLKLFIKTDEIRI